MCPKAIIVIDLDMSFSSLVSINKIRHCLNFFSYINIFSISSNHHGCLSQDLFNKSFFEYGYQNFMQYLEGCLSELWDTDSKMSLHRDLSPGATYSHIDDSLLYFF